MLDPRWNTFLVLCETMNYTRAAEQLCLTPRVERFLRSQPEASFSLLVDNTQVLLRALEAGQLDFALVEGFFDRSRYDAQLCRQEAFFGVCAPQHRLAGLDEITSERLILREPGSGTRAIFEEALHRQNYTLDSFPSVVTISDFSTIKSLVADGLGLSFLYAPVVEQELEAGTLARFDLAEVPMSGAFSNPRAVARKLISSRWKRVSFGAFCVLLCAP